MLASGLRIRILTKDMKGCRDPDRSLIFIGIRIMSLCPILYLNRFPDPALTLDMDLGSTLTLIGI